MTTELVLIAILSMLIPITSIGAFVIGYNINAPKKILAPKKKVAQSEESLMLERIENAQII